MFTNIRKIWFINLFQWLKDGTLWKNYCYDNVDNLDLLLYWLFHMYHPRAREMVLERIW